MKKVITNNMGWAVNPFNSSGQLDQFADYGVMEKSMRKPISMFYIPSNIK